ncbi:hypothetical protein CBR_g20114 [Chara braunii]|uniref:Uncharacterized protein n=1 Tax=Chara braunii TaxID=69332 RepID=A0A388KZV2_CHABU|nr:hypothetical protein CBR_g20114 [Chara braunii]|eukprot:GBG75483.1 hypothetical protein CBR_g20114 [Chara braunii]
MASAPTACDDVFMPPLPFLELSDASTEYINTLRQQLVARAMQADGLPASANNTGGRGASPPAFFRSAEGRRGSSLPAQRGLDRQMVNEAGGSLWDVGPGSRQTACGPSPVGGQVSPAPGRGKGLTTPSGPVFMSSPSSGCGGLVDSFADICLTPPCTTAQGFASAAEGAGSAGIASRWTGPVMLPAGRAFSAFQPFSADSIDAHQGGAETFGGSAGAAMCVPVESGGDKGGACGSQKGDCGDARGRPCPQNPPGGAGPAGMQACGGGQDPAVGMQWTAIQSPVPSRHDRGGIADTASRGQVDCNVDLYMQDDEWGGNGILSGDTVLVHSPNRDNEADDENDGNGIGSQADEGTEPHGVHSTQEGCNGSQEPLSSQRETTQLDADGSRGAARTRKRGDWAHLDTMALIRAKGERNPSVACRCQDPSIRESN